MALSLKFKIRGGYGVAFLLLLISYCLIFFIITKLANEATWVSHSYEIINRLEKTKAEITDAETGVRGFVITRQERFLAPYETGSVNAKKLIIELRRLCKDNNEPDYQQKMNALETHLNIKLDLLAAAIRRFREGGLTITDSMRANRENSKNAMDNIRIAISSLQEKEYAIMKIRNDKLTAFFTSTQIIAIASLLIALITVIYSLLVYNRENKAKEKADETANSYSRQLEARVNELNKVNIELQQLKSIEKFAATGRIARTMAHEVRNPLTNISLASEQLKEITSQNEDADVLLTMIGRNVNRINQLVSDLLSSTRFAQLAHTPENINQLLDETLVLAADRIELNQVRMEKYYGRNMPEIPVDKEKLKLAFLNLIVNAIESMQKGSGVLQLKTRLLGDQCMIEINDNGAGMDNETLQKIFEPYFTSKLKGNGLGLTNTQNIILNHKGSINVKSKLGEGTSFIIGLNVKQEENGENDG